MEDYFETFYNSLDSSIFKYFIKGESFIVYKPDFKYLPESYAPKDSTSNFLKFQNMENIIKEILITVKVPVEEYSIVSSTYKLMRTGYPWEFKDFMDICIDDKVIQTVFSIQLENTQISVCFIKDDKIMEAKFTDDDLFSNLYTLINSHNCIQIIYNDRSLERIFNNWGICCLYFNEKSAIDMLKKYMKIELPVEPYTDLDFCNLEIRCFDLLSLESFGLKTNQGKRLMNQWFNAPSTNKIEIDKRLDLAEIFSMINIDFKVFLDLKKIISKISNKKIQISEIVSLFQMVDALPGIISALDGLKSRTSSSKFSLLEASFILPFRRIFENFTFILRETKNLINFQSCKIILDPKNTSVENLICLEKEKHDIFKNVEEEFNRISKIYPKLKLSNRLFKITRSEYVKDIFDKSNLVLTSHLKTGVYFTTKTLSELKSSLEVVEEKIKVEEDAILESIRVTLIDYINTLEAFNHLVSLMDIYSAFSLKTMSPLYSRPRFDDKIYEIHDLFHPILENRGCIFNTIKFEKNLCILTGPNMGGKSTFIKALSMISLYAQIGCYVPAKRAVLPVFDKIFLRIGAMDFSSMRQSTFMVEMVYLNKILRTATSKSLVLIDELGRGTSAIDGISLVLAVKGFLQNLGCKTVMATHFSEIGDENTLNKKMCVDGSVLTYKIEDGICDTSFGIKVAEMANFPDEVLKKAKAYLQN